LDAPDCREPPRDVWFNLEEALELLAALEDARDALIDAGHLGMVSRVDGTKACSGQPKMRCVSATTTRQPLDALAQRRQSRRP